MIDITRAREIPGWMSEEELTWLAEQAQTHKCIVEIGSYLGRSTRALADNAKGVVYAVDDWMGPRDIMLPGSERKKLFDMFLKNMEGLQGKLLVVRADHKDVKIDDCPDMVFIDGGHTEDEVYADILRWLPMLDAGGIICGHDAHMWGVKNALDRVFGKDFSVAPGTTIWYCEPTTHPLYRDRKLKK